jgi:hypothetical protein
MMPLWWPRVCCVYCGERFSPYRRVALVLACERHATLLASDPMYAADIGEATEAPKGTGSR